MAQAFSALRGTLGRSAVVGLVFLAPLSGRAATFAVRVRWQQSTDPAVAGYRIYVRPVSGSYGAPTDVGMPAPASDGTLSSVLSGLDPQEDYAFAATAYLSDGVESGPSNEITLTGGACGPAPDALGRTAKNHDLMVSRFVLRRDGRTRRLRADGSFTATTALDPTVTGATLELRAESGALLYRAAVPGSAFRPNRSRHAFRYKARRQTGASGLKRLTLKLEGDTVRVALRASAFDLTQAMGQARLTWALGLGDECARDPNLVCLPSGSRTTSCR